MPHPVSYRPVAPQDCEDLPSSPRGDQAETREPVFSVVSAASYPAAVQAFLTDFSYPIPVWVGDRTDLKDAVRRTAGLYSVTSRPAPCARGILLGAGELPAGLVELIRPLARTWLDESDLGEELSGETTAGNSLLVAGIYPLLTQDPILETLMAGRPRQEPPVAFLTGRDAPSLAWFTAKQYAREDAGVAEIGLFTSTDRPAAVAGVRVYGERQLQTEDIRSIILSTSWRRVLFQGHGKDDVVNLADFTICGLNEAAPRQPWMLGPACAYGPTCFKPQDKIVQLRNVRAVEVVLSSCNSAALADTAMYDTRYQLTLNAIDGTARNVVAAMTVHDSARPENEAWMRGARTNASSAAVLNASLRGTLPYPAFLQFGLADHSVAPSLDSQRPDQLLLTVSARLTAYLASDLLPHSNPLRPRLAKLGRKVEQWVTRQAPAANGREAIAQSLTADLQSLDHALVQRIIQDPDNELMDFPGYFGDRSTLDENSVTTVRCQCGRPARRYLMRALVPTSLTTECVVCVRCGDVLFSIPESPRIWVVAAAGQTAQGGIFKVRLGVQGSRTGPVRAGLFVPRYLRPDCTVTPLHEKVRATTGEIREIDFSLAITPQAPPRAYYFTAFAVQDIGVSITRRQFGIVPAAEFRQPT
jgi:hypothetical protein